MLKFDLEFNEVFLKEIDNEIKSLAYVVETGSPEDYATYKELVGKLYALRLAKDLYLRLYKQYYSN